MSLTIAQLTSLLDALPVPACICDETGAVVSHNAAASEVGEPNCDWESPQIRTVELDEGWCLRLRPAPPPTVGTATLNGQPGKSPKSNEHLADVHALARGIAHEIRNPLSSILTAISLVRDDPGLAEETGMLLDVIKKEALRMKRILEEFSRYVKPPVPQPSAFDFAHSARSLVASLQRDGILNAAVKIEDALPDALNVWADETQIGQVLRQVLENAADTMPEKGHLRLSSRQEAGKAVLCIEDSGPGFSTESLQRAFQPFYSKKSQGTGLGLSIAHAVVEAAGGRIWLENINSGQKHNIEDRPKSAPAKSPKSGSVSGARVCIELPTPPSNT
ncbi:MAG: HAMP domain-containing histidine kinase [Abitibacteriaceae bacterium]|nr:HAMP domain-containing histidine kinase [Abditibacteriaceae bacterium]MBV9865038.1 HAMP domain-containing histidine kinase [Abditibacteriaceae bacterium]